MAATPSASRDPALPGSRVCALQSRVWGSRGFTHPIYGWPCAVDEVSLVCKAIATCTHGRAEAHHSRRCARAARAGRSPHVSRPPLQLRPSRLAAFSDDAIPTAARGPAHGFLYEAITAFIVGSYAAYLDSRHCAVNAISRLDADFPPPGSTVQTERRRRAGWLTCWIV